MTTFCSICTSTRGPFSAQTLDGRPVMVCAACDEPAFEKRGPERAYEPQSFLGTSRAKGQASKFSIREAVANSTVNPDIPAGWKLHRIRLRTGFDANDAYESLRGMPWFGPGRVKYAGATHTYFLFAYAPDVKLALNNDDPLAAIEQFRSKP